MQIQFTINDQTWQADLSKPYPLFITQTFDNAQPNHFGVEFATKMPVPVGNAVGDTRQGFSCNFSQIRMIPHCNGTHTECVGHIVDIRINLEQCNVPPFMMAAVLTFQPELCKNFDESYRPPLAADDLVITRKQCREKLATVAANVEALIVRTMPNDPDKKRRRYGDDCPTPFFTCEAIEWLNEQSIQHLLVDFPSIDRMDDDGLLTNHHLFWNVAENSHQLSDAVQMNKTITEMIYVDSSIEDGVYLLGNQFPAMATNAVPSRPVIYSITRQE